MAPMQNGMKPKFTEDYTANHLWTVSLNCIIAVSVFCFWAFSVYRSQ